MEKYSVEEYKNLIKVKRKERFKMPYDLVYDNFVRLGYDAKDTTFFKDNASSIVERLRVACWREFLDQERVFTSEMLTELIDKDAIDALEPSDAVAMFINSYAEHIYNLTLSNTQSRRSRAGYEFETIIELLLIGANIRMDSQGNIGKQEFVRKGLGKMVDIVSPGVVEYTINKRNTILISAKTTLRERWQEVPEEMGRTGASEMFLATLDETISDDVLETLYEANIHVTTTRRIKNQFYEHNPRVLEFEDLLNLCSDYSTRWVHYRYNESQRSDIIQMLQSQSTKHGSRDFVKRYYEERLLTFH